MRIAHVVTLASSEGAFGGPLSVALNDTTELSRRGHDVTLIVGWDGMCSISLPRVVVQRHRTVNLVPRYRFSGLVSPGILREIVRVGLARYDVLHVHLARDLITMPIAVAASVAGLPIVLQPHGMIGMDDRFIARQIDAIAIRRLLKRHLVLPLSAQEESQLRRVALGEIATWPVSNGISVSPHIRPDRERRDVVFCGRLHPSKRVSAFLAMIEELRRRSEDCRFSVIGPDEGELCLVEEFQGRHPDSGDWFAYEGALMPTSVPERLSHAKVLVLPSSADLFPMVVLEAMAVGTPVVVTEGCAIAPTLQAHSAAIVTDGTAKALAGAVETLLTNSETYDEVRKNALDLVRSEWSVSHVADQLECIYDVIVSGSL